MPHIGTGVEYALHCLLWLAESGDQQPSSRDLADIQGVSPSYVAKIFSRLTKAGVVTSSEGIRGGYRLSRSPEKISVLEVTDAIEGNNPLFDCKEIRGDCALFEDGQPEWACSGVCGIHAVMLRAEKAMRAELAKTSLASLVTGMAKKGMPETFGNEAQVWFAGRQQSRKSARLDAMQSQLARRRAKGGHGKGRKAAANG